MKKQTRVFLASMAAWPSSAVFACATCGCALSTDAAMGYTSATGWSLSLQYDYLNQTQLRTGTKSISQAQVAVINNAGGDQEVESGTANRYTTLGITYAPSADWNFRLMVPYVGFSLDGPDQLSKVRAVAAELSFPVGLVGSPCVGGYGRIWRLPVSFVIDRDGRLAHNGWDEDDPVWNKERLRRVVEPLLARK